MDSQERRLEGQTDMSSARRWWPAFADLLTDYLMAVAVRHRRRQTSVRGRIYAHTQTWGRCFKGRLRKQATKTMAEHAGILINMIDGAIGSDQLEDLGWFEKAIEANLDLQVEILNLTSLGFPQRRFRHLAEAQACTLARAIVAMMDEDPEAYDVEQRGRKQDAIVLGSLCAEWL